MDTVIIKLHGREKFRIWDRTQFVPEIHSRKYAELSPTEKTLHRSRPYLRRFVLHPKNLYEYKDEYIPGVEVFETLTEDRKDISYILKIEFSVPKLLYGNSVLEIVESDKQRIFVELKAALAKVNIVVEIEDIGKATLTTIHLCKNVLLPQNIKMREVLNELEKIDINKVFDVTGKKFKNGSRVLSIYSGVIEHVFYDKISDSLRPKNKRSDKGHINAERDFIEEHGLKGREIFRYEYRLKKTQTVRREVNQALGRDHDKTILFKDVFAKGILKKMTTAAWRSLIDRPENQLALFRPTDKLALLIHIMRQAEKHKGTAHSMNTALISYGLACIIQDHGAKEARRAIFAVWNTNHPERLSRRMQESAVLTAGLPYSNGIAHVDAAIEKCESLDLDLVGKSL